MKFEQMSVKELAQGIKSQKFTSLEVVEYFIRQCEEHKDLNAIIEIFEDSLKKASALDKKIARGEKVGALAGIPIAIKDNISCKGKKMSCASKFMQNYISPYSATIIEKLEKEDAIIFARTNMDEFAMGGSCESSCYGPCKNAYNQTRVSGGSSGGSAVAVAGGLCPIAIGTDTGGSIRQPSSFNGVVGMKPTYGRVSRYGIVAFASSTDQAGPITKTIQDNQFVLEILAGLDVNDATTISDDYTSSTLKETPVIGICKELKERIKSLETYSSFERAIQLFEKMGYKIVEVEVPHILDSLACYYILTPAEATSNLARFDGVKYTSRSEDTKTLEEVYVKSRSEGFGEEVQRRIMLGNFVLSSGYIDAYYKKAKKLQTLLRKEFAHAFKHCDVIISPTTPNEAFEIGGKIKDPVSMYLEDLFTVPASIAGIPALSIPYAKGKTGLPLGLQFMGAEKSERLIYSIAEKFEKILQGGENERI